MQLEGAILGPRSALRRRVARMGLTVHGRNDVAITVAITESLKRDQGSGCRVAPNRASSSNPVPAKANLRCAKDETVRQNLNADHYRKQM